MLLLQEVVSTEHHMQSPLHGRKREVATKRKAVLRKVAIINSRATGKIS